MNDCVDLLSEVSDYFKERLEEPTPLDVAIRIRRLLRNVEEVMDVIEGESRE